MHDTDRPTGPRPSGVRLAAAALGAALALSCSTVFTSSITGTIIDREDYDDGTTTGIAGARVILYTDETAWDEDYAAYVDGDESTLPDGSGRTAYRYFQSTVTDAQGGYEFSGFVWEACFPEYGKTADRRQVYLLIYHPDYGLWRNPVPLYVVSDVTNRLDAIRITDLWNEGRMAGRVVDWSDGDGLGGVTVGFTVADSWAYDAGGAFTNVVFPDGPTTTVTTDGDGRFAVDLAFRKMPDREADRGTGPVRVSVTKRITDAVSMAISIWRSMSSVRLSTSRMPIPPVSTSSTKRPSTSSRWGMRSRVTPAVGSTIARRRPANQLKRLDFPTLGRPTMTTWGIAMQPLSRKSHPPIASRQAIPWSIGEHLRRSSPIA